MSISRADPDYPNVLNVWNPVLPVQIDQIPKKLISFLLRNDAINKIEKIKMIEFGSIA